MRRGVTRKYSNELVAYAKKYKYDKIKQRIQEHQRKREEFLARMAANGRAGKSVNE